MGDTALKNLFARIALEELETDGDFMTAVVKGRAGERLGGGKNKVMFLGQHGFGSAPPSGSTGMAIFQNGNPDQAFIFGLEHPGYRVKGLKPGESVLYDHLGNVVKIAGSEGIKLNSQGNPVDIQGGSISIGAGGGSASMTCGSMEINATGPVTINSPRTNIGGDGGSRIMTENGPSSKAYAVT